MVAHESHHGAVLIVDDEQPLRELIARVVESVNGRSIQAADGAEALGIFQANHADIDVIISDVNMPVMDGFTFLRAARAIAPTVKMILSSGSFADVEQREVAALGLSAVLPKPYTTGELVRCVESVLRGPRAEG